MRVKNQSRLPCGLESGIKVIHICPLWVVSFVVALGAWGSKWKLELGHEGNLDMLGRTCGLKNRKAFKQPHVFIHRTFPETLQDIEPINKRAATLGNT
jgi:hypothetical protein